MRARYLISALALAAVSTACSLPGDRADKGAWKHQAVKDVDRLESCPPLESPIAIAETLVVDGRRVNDMLRSPKARQAFLSRFRVKGEPDDPAERVRALLEDPPFEGIAGIYGREVLLALSDVILGGDEDAAVEAAGQITHYGLNFDGSGCMRVNTRIVRKSETGTSVKRYKWHVRVARGGFSVVPKSDENDKDPFPGTLDISDNQDLLDRIDNQGFKYKLWAEGYAIKVHDVFYRGPNDGTFSRVSPTDPERGHLYRSSPSSCIDMMFQAPPPSRLPPGAEPPFYCLGRCDHPRLINTM